MMNPKDPKAPTTTQGKPISSKGSLKYASGGGGKECEEENAKIEMAEKANANKIDKSKLAGASGGSKNPAETVDAIKSPATQAQGFEKSGRFSKTDAHSIVGGSKNPAESVDTFKGGATKADGFEKSGRFTKTDAQNIVGGGPMTAQSGTREQFPSQKGGTTKDQVVKGG
ncbi:MAG: hypothetical protein KF745_00655 [Phycisphaeraceae bacterium]|nr:hypothetical protein [Phycisphaeraceae bacterium]